MAELRIDRLRMRVDNGAGHEHRLEAVARQAGAILAARLAERLATTPTAVQPAAAYVNATPVRVSLAGANDAALAHRIAGAWLAAVTPTPDVRRMAAPPRRPA